MHSSVFVFKMLLLTIAIAAGFIVVERIWPATELPKVRAWWWRVAFVNAIQLGLVILAGHAWDRGLQGASILGLGSSLGPFLGGSIAYLVSTFIYYWWHRFRHDSRFFWRLCHQLHHSPRRIELLTSFYKHPVEILINSVLSALIVYTLFGLTLEGGAFYTFLTAVAEYFYHWNIRTPKKLGYFIQRPESHRIHHQYRRHTKNFADLPVWDMLFGTFENGREGKQTRCGFDDWREDRFEDILAFRDVHAKGAEQLSPLHLLPTCIGCKKKWACTEARQSAKTEGALN